MDRLLVGEMKKTTLKLHEPILAEPLKEPRPNGHYATVLKAADKFQFYYRGDKDPKVTWKTHGLEAYHDGEVTLYAESKDGIAWTRPKLGLFEHPSFPEGNIVLMNEFTVNHNFTPFIDTKPGVPAEQKYKALGGLAFFRSGRVQAEELQHIAGLLAGGFGHDGNRCKELKGKVLYRAIIG